MILTKPELIDTLQQEVRILLHLAGKVETSMLDYRPTPKQRSTLELLRYMAIMGPTQLTVIEHGVFDRERESAARNGHRGAGWTLHFAAGQRTKRRFQLAKQIVGVEKAHDLRFAQDHDLRRILADFEGRFVGIVWPSHRIRHG